jgi:hypothetical protein
VSRPSTPVTAAATARGTQTIDLEPLLASVRFRGEAITRLDVEVVRLLVSPIEPFAGWEIRRSLLEAVHGSSAAAADADVVPRCGLEHYVARNFRERGQDRPEPNGLVLGMGADGERVLRWGQRVDRRRRGSVCDSGGRSLDRVSSAPQRGHDRLTIRALSGRADLGGRTGGRGARRPA